MTVMHVYNQYFPPTILMFIIEHIAPMQVDCKGEAMNVKEPTWSLQRIRNVVHGIMVYPTMHQN